jgi:hypothetical protein
MANTKYEPYRLPSQFTAMESHLVKNKNAILQQVLNSIDYALAKKLQIVEVFCFKDSNFIITLSEDKFQENIANIYDFYIKTEQYELCKNVKQLENRLLATYEQKTQKDQK